MDVLNLLFYIVFFISYIITDQDIWSDLEIYIQFSIKRFCILYYVKVFQNIDLFLKNSQSLNVTWFQWTRTY